MITTEISPGDRYRWAAHPNQPALRVEGIDGLGALAAVKTRNESTGVQVSFGISEFRLGIANGKFSKLPQACEKPAQLDQEQALPGLNDNLLIPQSDAPLLGSVEGPALTLAEEILGPEICATDQDFERATAIPALENFPEVAALAGRDPVTDATIEEIRAVIDDPGQPFALTERLIETMPAPVEEIRAVVEKRPTDIHANTTNEWYTPARYVESAREVLGNIDLDPASNAMANQTVKADAFYTAEMDGFRMEWYGRVWLNPPYNDGGSARWSARLIEMYERGFVEEAILLVNASTEAGWFKPLWGYPICFTDHRIAFYGPGEKKAQPRYGNAFVYLGPNPERFREVFAEFGAVTMPPQATGGTGCEPTPLPQTLDALRAEEAAIVEQIKVLNARLEEVYRLRTEEEAKSEKRQELEALMARVAELNRDLGITA